MNEVLWLLVVVVVGGLSHTHGEERRGEEKTEMNDVLFFFSRCTQNAMECPPSSSSSSSSSSCRDCGPMSCSSCGSHAEPEQRQMRIRRRRRQKTHVKPRRRGPKWPNRPTQVNNNAAVAAAAAITALASPRPATPRDLLVSRSQHQQWLQRQQLEALSKWLVSCIHSKE